MDNFENINKTIAENIAFLRTTNKMTQLELAEKLNYSDKAVSKWERGDSVPDIKVLLKIASIFQVNINYLLENHGIEELPIISDKKKKVNLKALTTMSLVAFWTAVLLAFIICYIVLEKAIWHILVYAVPVSLVMMLVFNSTWNTSGKRAFNNFLIISALCWDALVTVWFTDHKLALIMWLGIPIQIIVFLSFRIFKKKK